MKLKAFLNSLPVLFSDLLFQKGTSPIDSISTDSRQLGPHTLFIALHGERWNAHEFIPEILSHVSAIAVSETLNISIPSHITVFKVPDTLLFYQKIAQAYRSQLSCLSIAVTGSAGKTTTKEWLALLLSHRYTVYKSQGNFNNLVGVPFSVLEVKEEQIAVFELGSGKIGDIPILREIIQPQIAIVTSIGEAHMEYFHTLENIAKEKSSIGLHTETCYTIKDIPYQNTYFSQFDLVDPQSIFECIIDQHLAGYILTLQGYRFVFPFYGEYNLRNLALAVKVALSLNISAQEISQTIFLSLPSYRSYAMDKNQARVILDCYNANFISMQESFKALSHFEELPILILGDMLEMGGSSEELHRKIGQILNQYHFPFIFFIGQAMEFAHQVYKGSALWAEHLEELKPSICQYFQKPSLIFVKGSRGIHLEDLETW